MCRIITIIIVPIMIITIIIVPIMIIIVINLSSPYHQHHHQNRPCFGPLKKMKMMRLACVYQFFIRTKFINLIMSEDSSAIILMVTNHRLLYSSNCCSIDFSRNGRICKSSDSVMGNPCQDLGTGLNVQNKYCLFPPKISSCSMPTIPSCDHE